MPSRPYPFESHTFELEENVKMHFLDEGPEDGEVLLMLHGNPTWSYFYRELIGGFRHKMRCVVPDHVGCGYSSKPEAYDYILEKHIDNLCKLVEHLKLNKITLVLHDWGGAIGMGLAVKKPDLIQKLVVLNTAAFWSPRIPMRIQLCRIPVLGEVLVRGFNAFARGAVIMASGRGRLKGDVANFFISPYDSWSNRIAVYRFVQDIPMKKNHRSWKCLQGIEEKLYTLKDKPTIIFWGEKDFCFDLSFLARWKKEFPEAKVHAFSDAGHYILEDASDRIIPELNTFLDCA